MIDLLKWKQLEEEMLTLQIEEKDLIEKFILGSGSGGQKINKTSSCVYLKHLPSGIEVKCQQTRSRAENRFFARRKLCDAIRTKILKIKTDKDYAIEKLRRQKRKRSQRAQAKILNDKTAHKKKKALRRVIQDL